jgi:hypothetical protein
MEDLSTATDPIEATSAGYLGRWHRLVSTTNWEKGRIIYEWRAALVAAGAPAAEYSDDAWSRRVGSLTGQHAGRLRRVYERFGDVHESYAGLYWSHFQTAIDWNDAEMWLEGALQNRWSVADMRRERWQAFGGSDAQLQHDADAAADFDDDSIDGPAEVLAPDAASDVTGVGSTTSKQNGRSTSAFDDADTGEIRPTDRSRKDRLTSPREPDGGDDVHDNRIAPFRPFADLPPLPDDLSEAFENFKLAILRHKTAGWQEVSCSDVLLSLDALKALATAPA